MNDTNVSSTDSQTADVTTNVVNDARFANTKQSDKRYKDFVAKVDSDTGQIQYTRNLKVTTLQIDRSFAPVITAASIKRIVAQYTDNDQTLLYVPDVDYMLTGKAQAFDEDVERGLPASQQAFYKPISLRDSVSF
jgi:hypothetical protein|tara:strand:+ start:780 stop:1184 length:405 start_codon:yes stop_codon:yes gene_type:complete